MKSLTKTILIGVLVPAGSLSANAQKVRVGVGPEVDLTKYKTYAWDNGTAGANPVVNRKRKAVQPAMAQTVTPSFVSVLA